MKKTSYIVILLLGLSLVGCGGGGGGGGETPDITAPVLLSQNPAKRLIQTDTAISLHFDESIDTTSFTLAGSLATESDGGVWSQTDVIDDTLTITPTTSWSVDTGRSLVVNVKDLAGNAMAELTLGHDVYTGTLYYVSSAAVDDTGDGLTPATAKLTIMAAITAATPPATVAVNAGDYPVSNTAASRVELVEGVSLYGGYSADFSARTLGSSVITDQSAIPGTAGNPNFAMLGGAGITAATLVDGFTLQGTSQSGAEFTSAIWMRSGAAPTVQNNTINGGTSTGSGRTYGMYNSDSSPLVKGNTITGGKGGYWSSGITNDLSSPLVQGNTITGGSGTGVSSGIHNISSSPLVQGNTITGGSAVESYGMFNSYSHPNVLGNTIHGGESIVIHYGMHNHYSSPLVKNNTIHGGGVADTGSDKYSIGPSWGIHNLYSSPIVHGNSIHGGFSADVIHGIQIDVGTAYVTGNTIYGGVSSSSQSYGIQIYGAAGSAGSVQNNTIDAGSSVFQNYAMYLYDASPAVNGNIFITQPGVQTYCFYEGTATSDPSTLIFNQFVGCEVLYQDEGTTDITDIDTVNALGDISGGVLSNTYSVTLSQ